MLINTNALLTSKRALMLITQLIQTWLERGALQVILHQHQVLLVTLIECLTHLAKELVGHHRHEGQLIEETE